ncbi:histidinol-phosphate transaminase [Hahella sp. CCB-MM4]|uniref:histidinol-phosphate transaminase n=1 Tax=Hahella sp. (strain CCB-MM4) TaxID=1926491 RepID=UPI000B9BC15B|nr:histidinol-phosphate transaminase [Hahella sp. CCB-MM4]OZG70529.1 histidinol-phosphate transaminase [Hahella sp. CCB-MM4]
MSNESRVERWVRPEIRAISAYHVASSVGMLKMDAMENPYDFPESLKGDVSGALSSAAINRYPDPEASKIKAALKSLYGLNESVDILFGNGSDEIIQILAMVMGGPGRTILSLEPSFVMYKMIATFTGSEYVGVPLSSDYSIDIEATVAAIEQHKPSLVFIAQPNNPTGNLFSDKALKAIVEASPGVVIIDEAYTAFTDADYMSWLNDYEHVLIMRTFSKVGLAGLRFGMLYGAPVWIEQFNKVRLPYNINSLTQSVALNALQNFDLLLEQTEQLRRDRESLYNALSEYTSFKVFPSEANFILVRLPHSAKKVFEGLKEQGVLIKCLDGSHPMLSECLRFTVGTQDENGRLLQALKSVTGSLGLA